MTTPLVDPRTFRTRYNEKREVIEWLDPKTGKVVASVTSEALARGGKEATNSVLRQLQEAK